MVYQIRYCSYTYVQGTVCAYSTRHVYMLSLPACMIDSPVLGFDERETYAIMTKVILGVISEDRFEIFISPSSTPILYVFFIFHLFRSDREISRWLRVAV